MQPTWQSEVSDSLSREIPRRQGPIRKTTTMLTTFLELIGQDFMAELKQFLDTKTYKFSNNKVCLYEDIQLIFAVKKQLSDQNKLYFIEQRDDGIQKAVKSVSSIKYGRHEETLDQRIRKKLPKVPIQKIREHMSANTDISFTGKNYAPEGENPQNPSKPKNHKKRNLSSTKEAKNEVSEVDKEKIIFSVKEENLNPIVSKVQLSEYEPMDIVRKVDQSSNDSQSNEQITQKFQLFCRKIVESEKQIHSSPKIKESESKINRNKQLQMPQTYEQLMYQLSYNQQTLKRLLQNPSLQLLEEYRFTEQEDINLIICNQEPTQLDNRLYFRCLLRYKRHEAIQQRIRFLKCEINPVLKDILSEKQQNI